MRLFAARVRAWLDALADSVALVWMVVGTMPVTVPLATSAGVTAVTGLRVPPAVVWKMRLPLAMVPLVDSVFPPPRGPRGPPL